MGRMPKEGREGRLSVSPDELFLKKDEGENDLEMMGNTNPNLFEHKEFDAGESEDDMGA